MLNMEVGSVVCDIAEQLISEQSQEDKIHKALAFSFDVGMYHYLSKNTVRRRKSIHFLIHRPYNYAAVWFAERNDFFARAYEIDDWKFLGSHDSCWRDFVKEAVFSVGIDMAREMNEELRKKGEKESRPIDFSQNVRPVDFVRFWDRLYVKVETDPTDQHRYRKNVKIIRE